MNLILICVLIFLGISSCPSMFVGLTMVDAQVTPSVSNVNSSQWYTYYSSVYNNNTYSCWTEGSNYSASNWTYLYTYLQSTSIYYSYSSGLSLYSTLMTSIYSERYNVDQYKRSVSPSLTTSCGYVNKWKLIPYQCPYTSTSFGSSCSQQNSLVGNEFWKTVYSGSSSSYCQYSPISSYQCNTFYDRIGNWSNSQWSTYYSSVTTCNWTAIYFQDDCSNLTNSFQGGISCSPYSAQYTSFCYPQYGSYSNFYTLGTSCKSYYQWFSSCTSCGYEQTYSYDSSQYSWKTSYPMSCRLLPVAFSSATAVNNFEYSVVSSSYGGFTTLPSIHYFYDPNIQSTYIYDSRSQSYYTYSQWSANKVRETQFCSFTWHKEYSWYNSYNGTTFWNFNVYPNRMCDVFSTYNYDDTPTYTSCSTSFSYYSSYILYYKGSYTSYGMVRLRHDKPFYVLGWRVYYPTQICQKCQSFPSPNNGFYSSCDSLSTVFYMSNIEQCQPYFSTSFTCSQILENATSTTPAPTLSPWIRSYSSWDRKWFCTDVGMTYSFCSNCQSYMTYEYNSPYCSFENVYTSSYMNGLYNYYYTLSQYCSSNDYSSYTTRCPGLSETTTLNSSVTTIKPTTTSPFQCSTNYCLNNGTCVTNGCPYGYSTCCVCPPDYVGERCETNRTFVITSRLRMMDSFLPSLLDPSTEMYKNYSSIFTSLWYNITTSAIRQTYGEVDTVNLRVVLTRFKPGSIIAILITHGAIFPSNVSLIGRPIQITGESLRKALEAHCNAEGGCDQFNLDRNHLIFNATPNVCEESSMHLCSSNAQCTFYGGVEYICSCLPGYRDESFSTRIGSVCTEICHKHKCQNGGKCSENMNSDVDCKCPLGFTGKYCEVHSNTQTRDIMWALLVGLMLSVLFNFVLFCHVMKKRKVQAPADSKESLID